jgi:general secretion pathway protein D
MSVVCFRFAALSTPLAIALALLACQAPLPADRASAAAPVAPTAIDPETGSPDLGPAPQDPQNIGEERRRFLTQKYLDDARRLRTEGQLEQALALLLRAKELSPAHNDVLETLAQVQSELDPSHPGTAQTYAQQMTRLAQIREERARAEVLDRLQSGRRALAEGRYDAAIEDFRAARLTTQVVGDVAWGDLAAQSNDMLVQAEQARDKQAAERLAATERETLRAIREAEEAAEARRQAQVERFLIASARAFRNRSFAVAKDLAFQAMQLDATNAAALNLHNASIKALREDRTERYYQNKRREFTKMLEAAQDLKVPQTDILRTDMETWAMATRRAERTLPEATVDPDDKATRDAVREKKIGGLSFNNETGDYNEVKKLVQAITDIPIIITPEAKDVISSESLVLEMEVTAPMSVENFLNLMTGRSENLAWTVRNGVVEITTKAKAGGSNILFTHDIRDLVYPLTEFLPPTVKDIPVGDSSSETPRTGGESDEKVAYIEPDLLIGNIKDATNPGYWDTEGGGTMEYVDGGHLIVTANPEMQHRVANFLNDQRRFATAVVTIESKFLTVTQNFLQEVGVDFRGLGGSGSKGSVATLDDVTNRLDDNASRGLDNAGTGEDAGNPTAGAFFNDGQDGDVRARTENFFNSTLGRALSTTGGATASLSLIDDLELQMLIRAVEKRQDVQVVNSQNLTVLNNSRANVAVINQTSYIRDFEVEVAQASFIADPKVDVIQDGIVLDVRPTITHDRKHITLSLQPTVAELIRPIPLFTTSLAGSTLPVTLQLPQLTVRSFATTVTVPDGGSVLIGGLREVLTKERRAEVPILGRIPLVSFFFKQEGSVDENTSLMVLVRANITDVKDAMERRR